MQVIQTQITTVYFLSSMDIYNLFESACYIYFQTARDVYLISSCWL